MTDEQIKDKQEKERQKYEVARQIRALLDEAKEKYGADDWDDNEVEDDVMGLVTAEL